MRHPAALPGAWALLLLGACAPVGPDYAGPPAVERASRFSALDEPSTAPGAVRAVAVPTADLAEWYRGFGDPLLDSLVARGLAGSPDLRLAAARVSEARAAGAGARAALLPTLDANASFTRQRQAERSFGNFTFPAGSGISFPTPLGAPGTEFDRFEAGFQAAWELDLFGGVRRSVEAGEAELAAAQEAGRDTQVALLAELARTYFELRGVQRRAGIARDNAASQRRTLALVRERRAAGLASDLDAERLAAQVEATEARLPELAAAERAAAHALAVLLGRPPGSLAAELSAPAASPRLPAEIPVGTPDDLLRRRPDVRQAERAVAASTARIGVATAELFPRVSLNGSLGRSGFSFGDLGHPANTFFTAVLPQIRWRILDGGRVRAEIDANRARAEQAAAQYEIIVLRAQREAEDSISRLAREQDRRTRLAASAARAARATALAREQYGRGLTALLEVLDAERNQLAAQDSLVSSETAVSTGVVALYRALGGGWRAD
ncbi:efflux transporter outer membrane subunit [Pararoseomonas sp. SCSIO 73927]|uniref:efflux transporter outer membrane subunit n=1 Tax=Pararoseomonas sp. SCSIO 73927 TaxID=3114537 RepID=UPI0030CAB7E5